MFDKTGTLTIGGARVLGIETTPGWDPNELLRLAASLEQASPHIVAQAILAEAHDRQVVLETPTEVREAIGSSLEGDGGGRRVRAGFHDFVLGAVTSAWARQILRSASFRSALTVFVAVNDMPTGATILADQWREAPRAIQALRASGVTRIVMVTGDRAETAEAIGAALDLDAVLSERDPADKVAAVSVEQGLSPTLMVGDGINDAPALAAANVGVAMGARGASASTEAADVVILVDQIDRVADAVGIARRTHRIAFESMAFGMGMSAIAMLAAAASWLMPIEGRSRRKRLTSQSSSMRSERSPRRAPGLGLG
jgi:P-type E1-E2 ATPase